MLFTPKYNSKFIKSIKFLYLGYWIYHKCFKIKILILNSFNLHFEICSIYLILVNTLANIQCIKSIKYPQCYKFLQIPEFDNLYLDMNGIIHVCSHPEDDNPHFRITEEKIFKDIFHYLEVKKKWIFELVHIFLIQLFLCSKLWWSY